MEPLQPKNLYVAHHDKSNGRIFNLFTEDVNPADAINPDAVVYRLEGVGKYVRKHERDALDMATWLSYVAMTVSQAAAPSLASPRDIPPAQFSDATAADLPKLNRTLSDCQDNGRLVFVGFQGRETGLRMAQVTKFVEGQKHLPYFNATVEFPQAILLDKFGTEGLAPDGQIVKSLSYLTVTA